MTEMEVAERKRSRGGFLNLFDWSGKSRKKLFSSSNQELSESKQNVQNPSKSWQSLIEVDEIGKNSTFNPRSDSSCSASTVSSDEGQGSRAPSVVARLMGLESLPVPNSMEPRLIPDFDPFFLRSSRKTSTWEAYENLGYVNLRNDYDGISWDHLESRTNKERNRPIERFQTETLPPRSAKPISVTHNKLLSPIRSPGFVQSRNPTYVMEEASRMIGPSGPSPRLAARSRITSSDSSSSLPIRIRDLKEKLEASQKTPSPQFSNGTGNKKRATTSLKTPATSKFLGKSSSDSLEDKVKTSKPTSLTTPGTSKLLGKSNSDGLKGKMKTSKPTSAHTKANTVHKLGSSNPSCGHRNSVGQKEKMETKSLSLKESYTSNGKSLLKQNNQKQNCRENQLAVTPKEPNQKGNNKVANKVLVESGSSSKKLGFPASVEKNTSLSLSRQKNLPRNKKPPNGAQERGIYSDKRIKRGEKLIKCNITVDAGLTTGEADRKKDVDVISFTFSSPIKGLSSDSRSSTKTIEQDTESAVSFNKISGDSLNILLEQKLRELTSKIESSCSNLTQEESSCSSSKDWMNGFLSMTSEHDKSTQNGLDKTLSESESVSDCTSLYNNRKFQREEQEVNSFSGLVTEQSSSDQEFTWASSNEYEETELSESMVTSTFSEAEEGHNWEFDCITKILTSDQLMVKEFSLGMATDILPLSLFNEMNSRGNTKANTERKTLFDCVNQILSFKCEQMLMGSCRGLLGKEGFLFERKEQLAEEVNKEIQELKKMRDMMMDELVDNDMSSFKGRWLDFEREAYEEGIDIEEEIVSALVDELVRELVEG